MVTAPPKRLQHREGATLAGGHALQFSHSENRKALRANWD
jgi:hypothetical protein